MTLDTLTILFPAFIAGLLVFAAHVPLGMEVLKRGIIFIDLAIAQIAALGVIAAGLVMHDAPLLVEQGLALVFALLGAWGFQLTERKLSEQQEAIIGASFVVASSLAILLVANNPHGGEELQDMLAGQILWVNWQQIAIAAFVYAAVLTLWFTGRGKQHFYPLFAVTVTISVQLVGVYLVFASLILPALASLRYRRRLLVGYVVAFLSLISGLLLSTLTDLPTGTVLVCILAVVSCIASFLTPRSTYPK